VIFALFASVDQAHAVDCQASTLSGDGYWDLAPDRWSPVLVQGERGIDKSLLHWPAPDTGPNKTEVALVRAKEEKAPATLELRPLPPVEDVADNAGAADFRGDRWRLQ
jgi:hypothetical protein